MSVPTMHYNNVLKNFKTEWDTYQDLRDQDTPEVPLINDKESDRKVIKWVPVFLDCMNRSYGIHGPLSYVLRENPLVPTELQDPLQFNGYYGASGSLHDELNARLPHTGPIFKNDNCSVFIKIEKACRGTSVESTVKAFSRRKDGRGAFLALIANHAGDTKYRAINKKRMNLLQTIKWNGRAYPLETHVSNHRQAVDDLKDCSNHITVSVPDQAQRVEYLIDSITCNDSALQAAIGLVRANTNNMRNDFEVAASALIEVDPYRKSQRGGGKGGGAQISSIDFKAGRGSTGVDLRWHPKKEFKNLTDEQREELTTWMKTSEGRKHMKKSRESSNAKRKRDGNGNGNDKGAGNGNWKKKFKKAIKTPKGLAHVMAVIAEEEQSNAAYVSALQSMRAIHMSDAAKSDAKPTTAAVASTTATPSVTIAPSNVPATAIKLASILKKK